MLFSKEPNMSYTDMCIFFDNNFYSEERDEEKCYKYMYLVYYMLAYKKAYFKNYGDYDEFAEYATITIYSRYLRKLKNGEKIKSLLNYAKATLYPLKVAFQKEYYREIIDSTKMNIDTSVLQERLRDGVQQQYNYDIEEAILDTFRDLPVLIWDVVMTLPYKNNIIMSRRLYLSIYLTFIKEITFSYTKNKKIESQLDNGGSFDLIKVTKLLKQERLKNVVVWRLPNSIADYIKVLVNRVKISLQEELKRTRDYYKLPDEVLDAILNTAWTQSTNTAPKVSEES